MQRVRDDIVEIVIEGLLAAAEEPITLPLRNPDHMTVLCGINGTGKSTVLRIIDGILNSDVKELRRCVFSRVTLTTQRGTTLIVEPFVGTDSTTPNPKQHAVSLEKGVSWRFTRLHADGGLPDMWTAWPWEGVETCSGWRTTHTRSVESWEGVSPENRDALNHYFATIKTQPEDSQEDTEEAVETPTPDWLIKFAEEHSCTYVPASREAPPSKVKAETSSSDEQDEWVSAHPSPLEQRSRQVAALVQEAVQQYAQRAGTYDYTFLEQMLEAMERKDESFLIRPDVLAIRWEDMLRQREQLVRYGIGKADPMSSLSTDSLPEETAARKVVDLYCSAMLSKLGVFDSIRIPWEMLLSAVNEELFNPESKQLDENILHGFRIRNMRAASSEARYFDFDDLSSGEQQELVLQFDQFFGTQPGGFLLVDEPEISLHVDWQRRYLDDLEAAAQARGFYCIIATHSPTILGSHGESVVELGPR